MFPIAHSLEKPTASLEAAEVKEQSPADRNSKLPRFKIPKSFQEAIAANVASSFYQRFPIRSCCKFPGQRERERVAECL